MKSKNIARVAGISLLHVVILAGLSFSGGCKSPVILAPKAYIPAPAETLPAAEPELQLDYKAPDAPQIDIKETAPVKTETINLDIKPVKSKLLTYKVVRGDSFWLISQKYGVSQAELASCNNMTLKQPLKVGQVLTIPPGGRLKSASELAAALKKAKAKKRHHKTIRRARKTSRRSSIKRQAIPSSGTYVVKSGDSPWKIAHRFGIKTNDLLAANGLTHSSVLRIGQKLVIPRGGSRVKTITHTPATAMVKQTPPAATMTTTTNNDKSTDKILDSVEDPVESTDMTQNSEAAQPAAPKTISSSGSSDVDNADTITLDSDKTVQQLATEYGVSVKDLEILNPDFPKDGKLEAGRIVLIPAKK